MEAIESRVLLSAYGIQPLAYSGGNATGANPPSTLVADAGGNLYGTTANGGTYAAGAVFEVARGSNTITTLASFNGFNGRLPVGDLAIDPYGNLYGATELGGFYGRGSVFEVASGSRSITTLASCHLTPGPTQPFGGVTLDSSGNLYGTTAWGGSAAHGSVYELAQGSATLTVLASFGTGGAGTGSLGDLRVDQSGNLYGLTGSGGTGGYGTAYEIASGSDAITTIASFTSALPNPDYGWLTLDSSGNLYGTDSYGGANGLGAVFEIGAGSNALTTIASFDSTNGAQPQAGLTMDASGNLYGTTTAGGAGGKGSVFEIVRGTSTITTLASLGGANGANPQTGVLLDGSGNIYGTAYAGGANNCGNVFEIARGSSAVTSLTSFDSIAMPSGLVVLDASGNLFGQTINGGPTNNGTVFEIATGSTAVTTLAAFNGTNGGRPAGLALDASGNLYGTTATGGANNDGTVFEIARGSKTITTLASLTSSNGMNVSSAPILDSNGNLYGTAQYSGAYGNGTVFELPNGSDTVTTVVSFPNRVTGTNYGQQDATGGLTLDASGNIYGTVGYGGPGEYGTVFEIAAGSSTISTLATFQYANCGHPLGGVTMDAAGNLYGTASVGGTNGDGAIFELALGSSAITTLASFNAANASPSPKLMLDASGNLYGSTLNGGAAADGTLFEIASGSNTITTLASFIGPDGRSPSWVTRDASGRFYGSTGYGGAVDKGTLFVASANPAPTVALTLTAGSNPCLPNQSLTFAATIPGAQEGEAVTLVDASNNNATVATGTLSGGSATLFVEVGNLPAGTHNLIALYGGDATLAGSQSAPYAQVVGSVPPPSMQGAPVINGDNPDGLYTAAGQTTPGQQRSMVEDIVYTFNEPVTITNANQAFTLAVAGPAGGTLPATLYAQAVANSNGTQWAVSLTGQPVGTIGSIANGEYSITINPAYVFAAADGVTSMAVGSGRTDNFYRLYGDVFGTRNVNNADYNLFKKSINTYNPAFDDFGTGTTSSNAGYNVFKKDLNLDYSSDGFVTTI